MYRTASPKMGARDTHTSFTRWVVAGPWVAVRLAVRVVRRRRIAERKRVEQWKTALVKATVTEIVAARNAMYAGGASAAYVHRVRAALAHLGLGAEFVSDVMRCYGFEAKLEAMLVDAMKDRRFS